jgi:hypothetical protein
MLHMWVLIAPCFLFGPYKWFWLIVQALQRRSYFQFSCWKFLSCDHNTTLHILYIYNYILFISCIGLWGYVGCSVVFYFIIFSCESHHYIRITDNVKMTCSDILCVTYQFCEKYLALAWVDDFLKKRKWNSKGCKKTCGSDHRWL